MRPAQLIAGFVCLPLLAAGCSLSPVYLVNRPAIVRCLPDGVRMDQYVETDWAGIKVTVERKLARLGAYAGKDGQLYDASGRRIEFFHHYDGGMPPPPGWLEEMDRRLREMKKTSTVIEIFRDPDWPLPV